MDPDRLDLSALDPTHDRVRWEKMVRSVASRGLARGSRPSEVLAQLVAWWRPALAMAAAAVALSWLPAFLASPSRGRAVREATPFADPVLSTTSWVLRDRSPETAEVIASIGADHASR
jgi:hypothetical protein